MHSFRFPLLLLVFLAGVECRPLIGQDAAAEEKSLSDVRGLTDAERKARPRVTVSGLIISRLPNERLFCLYDGEVGILVLNSPEQDLNVGERVEIEGRCLPDVSYHLAADSITSQGTAANLPEPKPDGQSRLRDPSTAFLWTEAEAVIRELQKKEVGWHLRLTRDGRTFTAVVPRRGKSVTREFRHSRVRVRGIIAPLDLLGENSGRLGIWIDDWNRILRLEPPQDPTEIRPRRIAQLLSGNDGVLESRRVKVRGQAGHISSTGEISLRDSSGNLTVVPNRLGIVQANDHLEVLGYLSRTSEGVVVMADEIRSYGLAGTATKETTGEDWKNLSELLRMVTDIRGLERPELQQQPPIRLTGVVTMVDTNSSLFYLADDSGSIRVVSEAQIGQLAVGDRITVSGVAMPGGFVPEVKLAAMNWIESLSLSDPSEVTGTGLLAGRHESELVRFGGVVRRRMDEGDYTWLVISYSDRKFHVRVPQSVVLPEQMVGAKIEIDAIVQSRVNETGQITGINLLVADRSRIRIKDKAPRKPFEIPSQEIGSLLQFQSDPSFTRQKRVVGTVVLAWPDRLFVRDETGTVEALLREPHTASPGNKVSIVGFTRLAELKPKLTDAIVQVEGQGELPAAIELDAGKVLHGNFHGQWVRLNGALNSVFEGARDHSLSLRSGSVVFDSVLPDTLGGEQLLQLAPGSLVELTGLCVVTPGSDGRSTSFSLFLNGVKDVRVIQQPSWWTPERSIAVVILLVLLIVAGLGWVQRLRGSVAETRTTLAASLEASPVAVCVVSHDGQRMLAANRVFLRQFGFTEAEANEKDLDELGVWITPSERDRILKLCRDRGAVRGMETQMRSGAGNTLRILLSGESIKWQGSRAFLLAVQDVTERFEMVNQLRESQKMEAVGQLAAGVAHDFNNILTIIQGNSEMISDVIAEDSELVELNDDLLNAARRASNLTRQLLAFSRKQLMRPEILDLNEVVEHSLRMLKRLLGAPIVVHTKLNPKPTHVYADTGMLDQVLMNLAVNSRDALPNGGDLEITTRIVQFAPGGRHAGVEAEAGPMVQLRVSDNGDGMPPETLEKIFEPFFTTKDVGKGTGLGLATVFGIVKQHRGWVEGESEVGRGTNINIFFPIAETAEDVDEDDEPAVPDLIGNETILAVEDEPQLIRMVERTFEKHGYTVLTAENGIHARELWEKHADEIDLFFTDIVLPRGVSGWDLAEEFGAQRLEMPIVYTSGYSPEFDSKGSILERGVNYIPKPFNQRELLTIIRDSLARNGESQG